MCKEKADYPIVLQTKDVMEIMGCSSTTAAQYIKIASAKLKEQGKIPPTDVVKNLRVSKNKFFEIYGI